MSEKTDKIIEELGYKPAKTKLPQPEKSNEPQGRDLFQTPYYAVDLLIPFVPSDIQVAWECACGDGKIVTRLLDKSTLDVYASDIKQSDKFSHAIYNFLLGDETETIPFDAWELFHTQKVTIITNPPFSLKKKFYKVCRSYKIPFALLIPADYSGWVIKACQDGCEKIVPTRRIDYITPSGLSGATGHTADFHSMWLTYGFNIGRTETFVELSLKDKKENI